MLPFPPALPASQSHLPRRLTPDPDPAPAPAPAPDPDPAPAPEPDSAPAMHTVDPIYDDDFPSTATLAYLKRVEAASRNALDLLMEQAKRDARTLFPASAGLSRAESNSQSMGRTRYWRRIFTDNLEFHVRHKYTRCRRTAVDLDRELERARILDARIQRLHQQLADRPDHPHPYHALAPAPDDRTVRDVSDALHVPLVATPDALPADDTPATSPAQTDPDIGLDFGPSPLSDPASDPPMLDVSDEYGTDWATALDAVLLFSLPPNTLQDYGGTFMDDSNALH